MMYYKYTSIEAIFDARTQCVVGKPYEQISRLQPVVSLYCARDRSNNAYTGRLRPQFRFRIIPIVAIGRKRQNVYNNKLQRSYYTTTINGTDGLPLTRTHGVPIRALKIGIHVPIGHHCHYIVLTMSHYPSDKINKKKKKMSVYIVRDNKQGTKREQTFNLIVSGRCLQRHFVLFRFFQYVLSTLFENTHTEIQPNTHRTIF